MRRLESDELILYYPEARREDALRFLALVEPCVGVLRARSYGRSALSLHKVVLILPELPYNNAFVAPRAVGYEEIGVVPSVYTSDQFMLESGEPPDAATIACHEVTHFVHLEQIEGFSRVWNLIFGQAYTPQSGFDAWFDEGLAVYYETLLDPGAGRLAWPYWQGVFAAGVAGRRLGGGDLSAYDRGFYGGNHYLVGSHFVKFLADRYGEDKLWKLIDVQARSIFFPFGINVRFWQAYRKSLSTLIDEFAADVGARTPVVARPPEQREVHDAGWSARYARARDGTEALVASSRDAPARLRVFAPDGRTLVDRDLIDVVPPRQLATSSPSVSGGLSFTADGRGLYFVAIDQDPTYLAARLVRFDIPTQTLEVLVDDLGGPGGSVSPDGKRYFFARANGDHHDLAVVDLETRQLRVLDAQPHGAFVAQPRVSPDGATLVLTTFDGRGFGLALHDAATGRRLRRLPTGALLASDASWTDDGRLVFLGSAKSEGGFQVHVFDLRDDSIEPVSRAPYLAFAPQAEGGKVRFLNREGWAWTVDEVALPPPISAQRAARIASPTPTDDTPVLETAAENAPGPTPPPPPSPLPPPSPVPEILSEAPASSIDRLFIPQLQSPQFGTTSSGDFIYGLSIAGADRLERHRWAVSGYYESAVRAPSFGATYANRTLAPVTLTLSVSQFTERDQYFVPLFGYIDYTARNRSGLVEATDSFYGNPVSAGATFDDRFQTAFTSPMPPEIVRERFAGGFVSATYEGIESTPYTGTRRLFLASTRLRLFPASWGTLGTTLVDLRGELAVTTPLPLLRRQTLTLLVIGRDLSRATTPSLPFLRVGGLPTSLVWRDPDGPVLDPEVDPRLPNTFSESLRGFEDHPFVTDAIGIAEATYRYPFIIDRGWASTLGILPSLFVRELDLNLFGAAAIEQQASGFDSGTHGRHEAAGGALTLSTVFGPAVVTLTYQIARRFTDDPRWTPQIRPVVDTSKPAS
jgi:Tol biopolymer transport system component